MTAPLISICIPTYNGAVFLNACLRSVLNQSFDDFEVIIVDDNSADETIAIATQYATSDSRVRIFEYKEHSGLGGAGNYNRCIEHARGSWIKFVFQDDLIAPSCLEAMIAVANQEHRFVACRRDFIFAADTSEEVKTTYLDLPDLKSVFGEKSWASPTMFCHTVLKYWRKNFVGEPTSMLIHKDCFEQYGLFDPNIATFADMECWMRIGSNEGLTIVPKTLATFRVHEASMSGVIREKRLYRIDLEELVVLHDLAFTTKYAALRTHTKDCEPKFDPLSKLSQVAQSVQWLAVHSKHSKNDLTLLTEWEEFCRHYPHILKSLPKTKNQSLTARAKAYITRKITPP